MKERVKEELTRVEQEHEVKVLLAVESGSRAWGFETTDSDWDCRFVYVHRKNWYLSVQKRRDVIEEMLPGDLDLAGWELRKALNLFYKSNPPLLEWLRSPITYLEDEEAMVRWRDLVPDFASPQRCFHHYLSMASGNYKDYLKSDPVRLKKYLYVLRPLLACKYIETHGTWVPMEFDVVLDATLEGGELRERIDMLVERKKAGEELGTGAADPVIDGFITQEMERLQGAIPEQGLPPSVEPLNEYFRWAIDHCESNFGA